MIEQKRIAFGYDRDEINRIVINPLQAQAVRLIYELYADGRSLEKISSQFFACGIRRQLESLIRKLRKEQKEIKKYLKVSGHG